MVWSITPNNRTAAAANTAKLTDAFKIGYTPRIGAGTYYVAGTIPTRPIDGCGRIKSDGCFGTSELGHPTRTGSLVRIVQLGKGPILRLSGAGFVSDDPIEWVGDGESAAIEVEGRTAIPTGRHRFRNQIFNNCGAWLRCLGGYYEGDKFIADENHADNCILDGCEGFDCKRVFWSQNIQAVPWKFRDCVVNVLGAEDKGCVVADLERGGDVMITGLVINHNKVTLFRLGYYSPNCSKLICRDFNRDRMPHDLFPGNYLRLVDYAGVTDPAQARTYPWDIEISGVVKAHFPISSPYDDHMDPALAFRGCENLPKQRWRINIPDYHAWGGK